jgi:hypothetical protein
MQGKDPNWNGWQDNLMAGIARTGSVAANMRTHSLAMPQEEI